MCVSPFSFSYFSPFHRKIFTETAVDVMGCSTKDTCIQRVAAPVFEKLCSTKLGIYFICNPNYYLLKGKWRRKKGMPEQSAKIWRNAENPRVLSKITIIKAINSFAAH